MRRTIIAGNWKMNKDLAGTAELIEGLKRHLPPSRPDVLVVICPPYTSLERASERLAGTSIALGAQDMSAHDDGAFTGEISWKMLVAAGCSFVILGHSERRQYHGETDELVSRKAKKAVAAGLRPILCVGESLEEREKGSTTGVVSRQVRGVLQGLSPQDMSRVVVAYEPVWAIGTGKTATPAQAQEVHALIRGIVRELYGNTIAEDLTIQYGGSVKADNASELLRQSDIDGALVGGACLVAESFSAIVSAAK